MAIVDTFATTRLTPLMVSFRKRIFGLFKSLDKEMIRKYYLKKKSKKSKFSEDEEWYRWMISREWRYFIAREMSAHQYKRSYQLTDIDLSWRCLRKKESKKDQIMTLKTWKLCETHRNNVPWSINSMTKPYGSGIIASRRRRKGDWNSAISLTSFWNVSNASRSASLKWNGEEKGINVHEEKWRRG